MLVAEREYMLVGLHSITIIIIELPTVAIVFHKSVSNCWEKEYEEHTGVIYESERIYWFFPEWWGIIIIIIPKRMKSIFNTSGLTGYWYNLWRTPQFLCLPWEGGKSWDWALPLSVSPLTILADHCLLLELWGSPDWMTSGRSWNGDKERGTCVQCLVQLPKITAVYLIQEPQRKMGSIRRGWSWKDGPSNRVSLGFKVDSGAWILNVQCGVQWVLMLPCFFGVVSQTNMETCSYIFREICL